MLFTVDPTKQGVVINYELGETKASIELLLDRHHLPSSDWLRSRIVDRESSLSHCVGDRSFTITPTKLVVGPVGGMIVEVNLPPEWRAKLLEEMAIWRMVASAAFE